MRACYLNNQPLAGPEDMDETMIYKGWNIGNKRMTARGDGPIVLSPNGQETFITYIGPDKCTSFSIDESGNMCFANMKFDKTEAKFISLTEFQEL